MLQVPDPSLGKRQRRFFSAEIIVFIKGPGCTSPRTTRSRPLYLNPSAVSIHGAQIIAQPFIGVFSGTAEGMIAHDAMMAGWWQKIPPRHGLPVIRQLGALYGAGAETAGQIKCIPPASAGTDFEIRTPATVSMYAFKRVPEKVAQGGIENRFQAGIPACEDISQRKRLTHTGNDGTVHQAMKAVLRHVTCLPVSLGRPW